MVYKRGVDNSVADALSRRSHATELISSISVVTHQWSADIIAGYKDDQYTSDLLVKLATDSTSVPHFSIHDGLLKYKNRVWIGNNAILQHQLIRTLHSSPMGGHSGIHATVKRVQSLFASPGLKKMVTTFVHICPTCQQAKPERVKYPGLLQPLLTPSAAWQVVSIDFVEGLPPSHGQNCILVVVDLYVLQV